MTQILRLTLYALPLLFLGLFYFYPLAAIVRESFAAEGGWIPSQITQVLSQGFVWSVLWFTFWQAAASTVLTLVVSLPLAYLFAHYQFWGKNILKALLTVPFVMPTVVTAAAFTALMGPSGLLNEWLQQILGLTDPPIHILRSVWGILIAHVFYNVSIVVRTVGGFWERLNPHWKEAAAVLGASPGKQWLEVTLPLLLPSIFASSLLVFLFCFTSFGVVLILGGLRYSTLEVEIYRQAVELYNLPVAATLSLLQIAVTYLLMTVYTGLQRRTSLPLSSWAKAAQLTKIRAEGFSWVLVVAGLTVGILLAPLLALVWRSFSLGSDGLTLQFYAELAINRRQSAFFVAPIAAVRNSLLYAVATMSLSLLIGIAGAYSLNAIPVARSGLFRALRNLGASRADVPGQKRPARFIGRLLPLLDPLLMLPLGTSAVTLGFGYILSMGSWRTSAWLIPVAHTLIAAPFVIRTFLPALRSLDPRLREAASVMGASRVRVWWEIDAPILFRAMLVAAIFAFTISLGEFGATLLISRPDRPTMPMVIFRAMGQPGLINYGQALAMSTILMAVSTVGILSIERMRIQDLGEF